MSQRPNISARISVLVNYLVVGMIGHIGIFTVILLWNQEHQLTHCNSSIPSSDKVYWTQHKHIQASPKVSLSLPIVLFEDDYEQHHTCSFFNIFDEHRISHLEYSSPPSLRAPPYNIFVA